MAQNTIIARTVPGTIGHRLKTKMALWSHVTIPVAPVLSAAGLTASVVVVPVMFTGYEYLILGSTMAYSRSSERTTNACGDNIYDFIDEMVRRDRIMYVHFRNVSAPNPNDFHEEFINTGHVDMYRAMKTYHDAGFKGFFIDDHVPQTHQDTQYGHQARAFANGYIQAMIEAVAKQ